MCHLRSVFIAFLVLCVVSCGDASDSNGSNPTLGEDAGLDVGADLGGLDAEGEDGSLNDTGADSGDLPDGGGEEDVADATDEDASGGGPLVLVLGESVENEVAGPGDEGGVDYAMDLMAGDVIRLVVETTRGDLQPAAYLYSPRGSFVEPYAYDVQDGRVVLDYEVFDEGPYAVRVRAYEGEGTGGFVLESACVAGPCLGREGEDGPVWLRVVAINDFHGHIEPPSDDVGGAAWLASHVRALRAPAPNSIFVSAGDLLGASPYVSARFHDEPTIDVMNAAGLEINAVGNHEFDEGIEELRRLDGGGCHPQDGCVWPEPFEGATFETLGANVVEVETGERAFPSFTLRTYEGVTVAFIGMTLEQTRSVTVPSQVEGLEFEDELETVQRIVPELRALGVQAIVVIVHQGGTQDGGANDCDELSGRIVAIAEAMDDEVDAILSGHTHDTYVCDVFGTPLTSAGSSGRWVTRLDMTLDRVTGDVTYTHARNIRVDHDIDPDATTQAVVGRYQTRVEAEINSVIGVLDGPLSRSVDDFGQSTLGFVIADSQLEATRSSAGAQIAFMNRGGIRSSLSEGDVTFGDAFAVQPFQNTLITMTLTGAQLLELLRGQFIFGRFSVLQPSSSLSYRIGLAGDGGFLVEGSVHVNGQPVDEAAEYRVTANRFVAEGGDGHSVLTQGTNRIEGPIDVDAFVEYLTLSPSPLPVPELNRITD